VGGQGSSTVVRTVTWRNSTFWWSGWIWRCDWL